MLGQDLGGEVVKFLSLWPLIPWHGVCKGDLLLINTLGLKALLAISGWNLEVSLRLTTQFIWGENRLARFPSDKVFAHHTQGKGWSGWIPPSLPSSGSLIDLDRASTIKLAKNLSSFYVDRVLRTLDTNFLFYITLHVVLDSKEPELFQSSTAVNLAGEDGDLSSTSVIAAPCNDNEKAPSSINKMGLSRNKNDVRKTFFTTL